LFPIAQPEIIKPRPYPLQLGHSGELSVPSLKPLIAFHLFLLFFLFSFMTLSNELNINSLVFIGGEENLVKVLSELILGNCFNHLGFLSLSLEVVLMIIKFATKSGLLLTESQIFFL